MKDYFEFKGVKYGVGTVVNVPNTLDLRWFSKEQIVEEAIFVGSSCFEFTKRPGWINLYESRGHLSGKYESYIEIVRPVCYKDPGPPKPPNVFFRTRSGTWEAHNDVCIGFAWYIAVMLLATIFDNAIGIWVIATIVYFCWKSKK